MGEQRTPIVTKSPAAPGSSRAWVRGGRRRRAFVAALAALAAFGVTAVSAYAAFSFTTSNPANLFGAGTVALSDNDGGVAMLALTAVEPGASDTSCIRVQYDGSLPANVTLYGTVSGALLPYLTLTVTRGTDSTSPTYDSCTNFTADPTEYIGGAGNGVVYTGLLSAFPATFATGIVDPTAGSPATWSTGSVHFYRFAVSFSGGLATQGLTGSASFTWEARNL